MDAGAYVGGVSARWYRQRGTRAAPCDRRLCGCVGADGAGRPKWHSVSLQGCPREVRLLLAGPYTTSMCGHGEQPAQRVARQLGRRGMVRAANLQALSKLCSAARVTRYLDGHRRVLRGLVDATAQGVTARDRAKDLPIRILHGGGHAAWLEAQRLQVSHPTLPLA